MAINQCITFSEAINKSQDFMSRYNRYSERNLLIGNGFSIDCCPSIFTYRALFDNANFTKNIKNVFNEFKTIDFEKIIKKINEASIINRIYKFDDNYTAILNKDAETIKTELVNVISTKHPEHKHKIPDSKFYSALIFLSKFTNLFTLNYDMLLYWTLMSVDTYQELFINSKNNIFKCNDGFGRYSTEYPLCWYKPNEQNVFYLHGALHLFDAGIDIIKAETSDDEYLMDSIKKRLDNNLYPLIVAEGTSKEKLEIITHNKYLQNALYKLDEIKGCIFIHGHSLDVNDNHILKKIRKNPNIKQIYISVFEPSKNFNKMQKNAERIFMKNEKYIKEIYYYDAMSANIWDSISEEEVIKRELEKSSNFVKMTF